MSSVEIGLLIAFIAAVAPWVAIYFQRRLTLNSEREINNRVVALEDITRQIENERKERHQQIEERTQADTSLSRELLLRQIDIIDNSNIQLIFGDLFVFQQIVNVYLRRASYYDKQNPQIAGHFAEFCSSIIAYIGRHNYTRMISKDSIESSPLTYESLMKAIHNEHAMLEAAQSAGKALLSCLESLDAIRHSDGSKLSDHFVKFSKTLNEMEEPYKRLLELAK